jgi:hypothetical protein
MMKKIRFMELIKESIEIFKDIKKEKIDRIKIKRNSINKKRSRVIRFNRSKPKPKYFIRWFKIWRLIMCLICPSNKLLHPRK